MAHGGHQRWKHSSGGWVQHCGVQNPVGRVFHSVSPIECRALARFTGAYRPTPAHCARIHVHAGATSAVADLQAAANDYRRWFAEREAAAARQQAALHTRMGQVAAEARDTVVALARVTEANNRTARALTTHLRPVAEGVESLAARLEAAAAELRGCRQALQAHRHRQQEPGAVAQGILTRES